MDITKWLTETAPPKANSHEQADALNRKSGRRDVPTSDKKHGSRLRRRSSSTDSSIIHVAPREDPRRQRASRKEERDVQHSESSAQSSDSSSPSSERSASSDDPFRRRPRHKTRHDKYDPDAKERKKAKQRKAKEAKQKQKKTKKKSRKKRDKVGTGIVHTFHAKNVPRERLTLRALDNVGFFKKAKASSPVKNRGLPDLVFTEMKFLQKRKHPPEDPETSKQQASNKRQKDKTRNHENEISTYFAPPALPLRERPKEAPTRALSEGLGPAPPVVTHSRQRSSSVRPTIELPGRPFLGFGSRGPAPVSSTRLTWSDSRRNVSAAPDEPMSTSAISVGHLNDWRIPRESNDSKTQNEDRQRQSLSRHNDGLVGSKGASLPSSKQCVRTDRGLLVTHDSMQQPTSGPEPTLSVVPIHEPNSEAAQAGHKPMSPVMGKRREHASISRSAVSQLVSIERRAINEESSTLGDLLNECQHAVNRAPPVRDHLDVYNPATRSPRHLSRGAEQRSYGYVAEGKDLDRAGMNQTLSPPRNPQAFTGDGRLPAMYRTASTATSARTGRIEQSLFDVDPVLYLEPTVFDQGEANPMDIPYPEYEYGNRPGIADNFDDMDEQIWNVVNDDDSYQIGVQHNAFGAGPEYALLDMVGEDLEYQEATPDDAPPNFWRPRRLY